MTENESKRLAASDDEILEAVRRKMSGVELSVKLLPDPDGRAFVAGRPAGAGVRSRIGFAGLAPLVLVAALIVVVVGQGIVRQTSSGPTGSGEPPVGSTATLTYRLLPPAGGQPSASDLAKTVDVLKHRLSVVFPQMYSVDSSGSPLPVNVANQGYSVVAQPPDRVVVRYEASYRETLGSADIWNAAIIRASLGRTGHVDFVDLPAGVYGTSATPGPNALPQKGQSIDPGLPALVTDADVDPSALSELPGTGDKLVPDIGFTSTASRTVADYVANNTGHYLAVAVDGIVLGTTAVTATATAGHLQLSDGLDGADANALIWLLGSGSLPVPLMEDFYEIATPTPGPAAGQVVAPAYLTPTNLPSNGRTLGNPNAPVTLGVWIDFRCPVCQVFATQTMPKLIEKYVKPGKLKISYQDFMVLDSQIAGSTESRDAAAAGRCAADQGKFWVYQDWLIANQSPIEAPGAFTLTRLAELATRAGLDMTKFEPCLTSGRHNAEVLEESGTATSAGVPAFFVNGVELAATAASPGAYDELAAAIDAALAASTALPTALPTASPAESPTASPTTIPSPATAVQTFRFYYTQRGDTLSAIAAKFDVTLARLIAANPQIKDPNHITLGEIIFIPSATWFPVVPIPTPASS